MAAAQVQQVSGRPRRVRPRTAIAIVPVDRLDASARCALESASRLFRADRIEAVHVCDPGKPGANHAFELDWDTADPGVRLVLVAGDFDAGEAALVDYVRRRGYGCDVHVIIGCREITSTADQRFSERLRQLPGVSIHLVEAA